MNRILPILFNTDMVRAILDGRKTVTRRICKDGNDYVEPDMSFYDEDKRTYAVHNYADLEHKEKLSLVERVCPICPGDILYVRETWQYLYELDGNEQVIGGTGKYYYAASDTLPFDAYVDSMGATHQNIPWRPSIHMPKEAARIWLKVTDVRVERLQEITREQILREGANQDTINHYIKQMPEETEEWIEAAHKIEFQQIWNYTLKKSDIDRYGWDANPWVWVIEFKRCKKWRKIFIHEDRTNCC